MKSIRCGRGIGDSLYLQAVVRHLLKSHSRMRVASDFPDVFRPLGDRVEVMPFTRKVDIVAHYTLRKNITGTTQFEDCCLRAGIPHTAKPELRLDWQVTNEGLVRKLQHQGKPVAIIQMPRAPMARTDGFGRNLLPDGRALQLKLDELRETHFTVQVGAGEPLYRLKGLHLDLANKTTVAELIDAASAADHCLGYVSFMVPLAESLGKPAHFVWSARGLRDGQPFIRSITPSKILHCPTSTFSIDEEILRALH